MTDRPISVAIVDDHPALRDGTAVLLGRHGIDVVATVATLDEARNLLEGPSCPEVIVLDIRLSEEPGLDLLRVTRALPDGPAFVVWTGYDFPQYVNFAREAGAAGFVLKTAPLDELVESIRIAAGGGVRFASTAKAGRVVLTTRERDVLEHVVAGLSNDEVAARLSISTRAIEGHLTRLYGRHGLRSRTELVARAVSEGWLELPPATAARGRVER